MIGGSFGPRGFSVMCSVVALSCARAPLDAGCPTLLEGDLVITEMRGAQRGADTLGQWVELFNASGEEIELAGVQLTLTPLSGREPAVVTLRDRELRVASGGYVVLGIDRICGANACISALPPDANYGMGTDLENALPDGALLELRACGALLDRVVYRALPEEGTLSLGGGLPDAAINDDATNDAGQPVAPWCVDDMVVPSTSEFGIPGTPGESNRGCP